MDEGRCPRKDKLSTVEGRQGRGRPFLFVRWGEKGFSSLRCRLPGGNVFREREECLKITCVLVLDVSSITDNCANEFKGIHGNSLSSFCSLEPPNNLFINPIDKFLLSFP